MVQEKKKEKCVRCFAVIECRLEELQNNTLFLRSENVYNNKNLSQYMDKGIDVVPNRKENKNFKYFIGQTWECRVLLLFLLLCDNLKTLQQYCC